MTGASFVEPNVSPIYALTVPHVRGYIERAIRQRGKVENKVKMRTTQRTGLLACVSTAVVNHVPTYLNLDLLRSAPSPEASLPPTSARSLCSPTSYPPPSLHALLVAERCQRSRGYVALSSSHPPPQPSLRKTAARFAWLPLWWRAAQS